MHQPEGSFMVRSSSSSPGSYALTMKGPQAKILHFLIQPVPNGFKLQVRTCHNMGSGEVAPSRPFKKNSSPWSERVSTMPDNHS